MNIMFVDNDPRGGYRSHICHLARSYRMMGYSVNVYSIKNKVRSYDKQQMIDGVEYAPISVSDAIDLIDNEKSILAVVRWEHGGKTLDTISKVLETGCIATIQSSVELNDISIDVFRKHKNKIIAIRKSMIAMLDNVGLHNSVYIPQPYIPYDPQRKHGTLEYNAICTARVDWQKNTHIIVEANKLLSENMKCRIYGNIQRRYEYFKLVKSDPDWKKNYYGVIESPTASLELVCKSKYVVDLTRYKGEGGGTQYTFLEAFDAGAILIVNKGWLTDLDNTISYKNAIPIGNSAELANVLSHESEERDTYLRHNGKNILKEHSPEVVVSTYESLF